jgi:galactose-3-O-sulfotransferase
VEDKRLGQKYLGQQFEDGIFSRARASNVRLVNAMLNQNDAVIFLHIPKTGGSTLYHILERHYPPSETVTLDTPGVARFKELPAAQLERYRLIQGHLYFGLHRFVPRRCTYVTFLRRPVDRVLSFYYYARSKPDHYLYRLLKTERLDLKTLLGRELTEELSNFQTRMLAGDEWEDLQCVVTRDGLERAKANLRNHFRVVGLLEEFEASLLLLHRAFEWPLSGYVRENVTKEQAEGRSLDGETRKLIETANSLDIELYEFARNLFEEQYRAAGESFNADLRHFRQLNEAYSRPVPRFVRSVRRTLRRLQNSVGLNSDSHLLAL